MNYDSTQHLGSAVIAVGSALFSAGKSGYDYYETRKAVNQYNADMEVSNAQNTADARNAARRAGYQENLDRLMGNIDKEKAKRYLIIGAAIGVPIIAGLVLSRKR